MSRKRKHIAEVEVASPAEILVETGIDVTANPVEIHPEVEADNAKANSVVKAAYKHKYADRAKSNGLRRKAAQRSAWDWLAETLAGECLGEKDRIDIGRFCSILEANGIEKPLERWPNQSKGWEGRLRMTGRLALQRIVAEAGVLKTADGETLEAPTEWVAKYKH